MLYNVLETMYMAYYAIGFWIYLFTLISYLPFIVSFIRMLMRDSETSRLIFYRNSKRLWYFIAAVDFWNFVNLVPDIIELCELNKLLPDNDKISEQFDIGYIDSKTMVGLCNYRV